MNLEIENTLDEIAAACGFLAQLLLREDAAAPASELPGELLDDWPLAVGESAAGGPDTAQGIALLRAANENPASVEELSDDFRALFVGPNNLKAIPWESVYRDKDRLVFQEQTFQVREAYAEFGYQAPRLNKEPDDHAGLELSFVGQLCVLALDGEVELGRAVSAASEFWENHVMQWQDKFAGQIIENAQTDLYRALGYLLRGALPNVSAGLVFVKSELA